MFCDLLIGVHTPGALI